MPAEERAARKEDPVDDPEGDEKLTQAQRRRIEAYENQCRMRLWELGVPALAVLACIVCLYACEDCLIGVMLFCAVLCFKDWVLVIVFITSVVLYAFRHPLGSSAVRHITNAAFEFVRTD